MTYRGAREPVFIPRELAERMNALARKKGATPFMALMAAFSMLIYRWSGQGRFLFGTPVAGRSRPEIEGLVGVFVNTLVLHADVTDDPSFRELLDQSRRTALDAFGHMELPFEQLVDAVATERDLSRAPLIQAMMVLHNLPATATRLGDLELSPIPVDTGTSKLDLLLEFLDTPDGLRGSIEYATDLFTARTVARLAQWLVRLLDAAVADPDVPISRLSLVDPTETAQIAAWNDTAVPYPSEKCIHELFEDQAKKTPDAVAVECEVSRLTYSELNAKAKRLAHYLRSLGVGPEVRVGIYLERSVEVVVAILAVLKAGGAYVPLDPKSPVARLGFMAEDAGLRVLIGDSAPAFDGPLGMHWIHLSRLEQTLGALPDEDPAPLGGPDTLAYVIYTSGSTGTPKGVAVTHRGVPNTARMQIAWQDLGPGKRVLLFASFTFDVSASDLFSALSSGATLVIASEHERSEPAALVRRLAAVDATVLPPALLPTLPVAQIPARLRLAVAGEPCPPAEAARFSKDRALLNFYGPHREHRLRHGLSCGPGAAGLPHRSPHRQHPYLSARRDSHSRADRHTR